jgi:4-methyl-5(b-hydroxyethyl)-thiazole monophosphate biosynthesis
MMIKKVLVVIADGSEEIEAVTAIDLFRRAKLSVIVASEKDISICSRGLAIKSDVLIAEIKSEFDLIYIPGGAEGAERLSNNENLSAILKKHHQNNKPIAAICAATLVLHENSLINNNLTITSHPSIKNKLIDYKYSEDDIVSDGTIFTSRGAGTAMDFVLYLIDVFKSKIIADDIAKTILYKRK